MLFVPYTELDFEIANSYLNVADADDIINKQKNSSTWQGLDASTKEMLLMQSSLAVDGALMYANAKTSESQLLKFPRNEVLVLPRNILFATALTALKYSNDDIFKNIKREQIGKHETEFFGKGTIDDDVLAFLNPLRATTLKLQASNHYE